ncbi:MAG TPA: M20/M25/M40 family metallo-hydrolase [Bryobacteraceae bacterium]|nr:M20/M25/M40 family metallo-hydrolase [Bryobacteraceae bacterium]
MRGILAFTIALACARTVVCAENDKDLTALHEIKVEAFNNSKVMDHLASLADLYGPRLTASPEWEQAAQWAMQAMKGFGLVNVHEEKWGPFGRSWSLESYNIDMLTPRYSHLVAVPLAWSSQTNGVETGDVLFAPIEEGRWYEFKKNHEALEHYKAEWHGKLKGKIVLLSDAKQWTPSPRPVFRRLTDTDLADIAKAPQPTIRRNITVDQVQMPDDPDEIAKYMASLPNSVEDALFDRYDEALADLGAFLKTEGVVAVLKYDARAHNGLLFAEAAGSFKTDKPMAPPTFVVTEEQYSRMQRLLEKKELVSVRLELKAKYSNQDVDGANIVAEIPGQNKPGEVVMIGAHFDSWHSGTGATDNGAGSAVMLEVMRILKKLDLPLDRTVRIGLWSGEEQGLFGSRAYVKQHFADVKTGEVKPEQAKLDAYLNLDNGSGKIRGIYLENNDAIRPLFEHWLAPFRDMDVTTVSLRHTGGTDHLSFDDAGIPAFQFIQDPLDYGTITHHSDMDTYPHAVPEDLMQASAVIASLVYDISNRDQMVPRKMNVQNGKLVN